MSPTPPTENEGIVTDVSEWTIYGEAPDTDKYVKFSSLLLLSIVLCLATLCVAVDNTITSTAVPRITHDFHSIEDVGWYAA